MPTFNRLNLLKRAIKSFEAQDYIDAELIILDNGCTDGSSQFLANLSNPNIKLISNTTNNPKGSLNKLWLYSEADLICQLHDDDELTKSSITDRVELFKRNKFVEVVYGGWINQKIDKTALGTFKAQAPNPCRMLQNEYINFTTMMWKNSIKDRFMFDEEMEFQVDSLFKIRCGMETSMSCVENPVMLYTIHQAQATYKMRATGMLEVENKMLRTKINNLYKGLFL